MDHSMAKCRGRRLVWAFVFALFLNFSGFPSGLAAEPQSIRREADLTELYPSARIQKFDLGKSRVVVLFLFKGSGIRRQVLHFYRFNEADKSLAWVTSIIVLSPRAVVRLSGDGSKLEVLTQKGGLVATFLAGLFDASLSEYRR
ncbi:hypothetical protein BH09VER1_BH09VER1_25120 [soil metagenome]